MRTRPARESGSVLEPECLQYTSCPPIAGTFSVLETDPRGFETAFTRDARFGTVLTQADYSGLNATSVTDGMGNVVATEYADGTVMSLRRFWAADLNATTPGFAYATVHTERCGANITTFLDGAGRGLRTVHFNSNFTETDQTELLNTVAVDTVYGVGGVPARVSNPFFAAAAPGSLPYPATDASALEGAVYWTALGYDAAWREASVTHPDTSTQLTSYDGFETARTDENGGVSRVVADANGRKLRTIDAINGTVSFAYSPWGTVQAVMAADGSVTTYALDEAERVVGVTDPDRGTTTYVHDALGQTLLLTAADGAVTTMTYDVMGRALSTTTQGGESTTWKYDTAPNGRGKLASVETLPVGFLQTVEYDALTRPVRTNTTVNGTLVTSTLSYDQCSRAQQTAAFLGPQQEPLGRVFNVFDVSGSIALHGAIKGDVATLLSQTLEVNARGQTISEFFSGSSEVIRYSYADDTTRLTSMQVNNGAVFEFNQTFTYDSIGNPTSRAATQRDADQNLFTLAEQFEYDPLNRLFSAAVTQSSAQPAPVAVAYDAVGRILRKSDVGTYTYGGAGVPPHGLSGVALAPGASFALARGGELSGFSFDAMGRQTFDPSFGLTFAYWPGTSRASSVSSAAGVRWQHFYGPDATNAVMEVRCWGRGGADTTIAAVIEASLLV